MSEEKKEETQEDFKAEWDKQKQETQQAEANYQKAVEEKQVVVAENAAIAEQLEANQLKVTELQEKAKAQEDAKSDPDFDPDLVDKNVIKELTQARADRKALRKQVADLEGKATNYEQTEQQRANKTAEDLAVKKMCDAIEAENSYGPQFRNDAIALATKLVKDGKEEPVRDGIDGMILMKKCYKTLSEKAKPDETVNSDTGAGGTITPSRSVKTGTTQDVLADMKQDKSWLDEDIGSGEPDLF